MLIIDNRAFKMKKCPHITRFSPKFGHYLIFLSTDKRKSFDAKSLIIFYIFSWKYTYYIIQNFKNIDNMTMKLSAKLLV